MDIIDKEQREKVVIKTSIIGIAANILLSAFKALVGLASHSIAVILDAVNNLSDALSSVITIVGAKLSSKPADKKHPLGYGRIEYLSAMIVSGIILYAGITSAVESVKKIIHPEAADYSTVSLIIISVAILTKLILGKYVKSVGKKARSASLVASGSDALFDAVLSSSVLVSAVIYILTGVSLEAYVGVVISVFIIKAGIEMMLETLNDILGKREDPDLTDKIKKLVAEEPQVMGAFDLVLYNYGPDRNYGSVHIELPDTMPVKEVDSLTRRIEEKVYRETGVILTGVGVYSYNTEDDNAAHMRDEITKKVLEHEWALQLHGFYLNNNERYVRFDVVMSFEIKSAEGLKILYEEMQAQYPEYRFYIIPDVDISVS